MLVKLAWKNVWRNKKRTLIVAASVMFAVVLSILMRSAQLGSYAYMIDSATHLQTGYLQVQHRDYRENRSLEKSYVPPVGLKDTLTQMTGVSAVAPRLETFALVSHDSVTRAVGIQGIDPAAEEAMTRLSKWLVKGSFLEKGDSSLIMGAGLAKKLNVTVGDSVVLYGMGYHGQTAAAILNVRGLLELPLPQLNNSAVLMSLSRVQYIYMAPGRVTALVMMLDHPDEMARIKTELARHVPAPLTVIDWQEMMPELKQYIQIDNASGLIMLAILYMVIAFGVFGTVMMMTAEREREFGILNALGMKKTRLMAVSAVESVMVSFIGALAGLALGIPLALYYVEHPIRLSGDLAAAYETLGIEPVMSFSARPDMFGAQALVVFVIAVFCALYPLFFIRRMRASTAIRH